MTLHPQAGSRGRRVKMHSAFYIFNLRIPAQRMLVIRVVLPTSINPTRNFLVDILRVAMVILNRKSLTRLINHHRHWHLLLE